MVSKAREDFPEPDKPVKTTSESRGRLMSTFRRLCSRAPRTMRWSITFHMLGVGSDSPPFCDLVRASTGWSDGYRRGQNVSLGVGWVWGGRANVPPAADQLCGRVGAGRSGDGLPRATS